MEHADSVVHGDKPARSSSDPNIHQPNDVSVDNESPITTDLNKNHEISLTAVKKIMRQHLPNHVKVKDAAKMIFPSCVSKYISYITAKACERCQREHRQTLKEEDLLWAMENLGFVDHVEPLRDYLDHYRRTKGNLSIRHGASIPINDGQAINNNKHVLQPQLVGNHGHIPSIGCINEPMPRSVGVHRSIYGPLYGSIPLTLHGSTPAPTSVLEPQHIDNNGPIYELSPRLVGVHRPIYGPTPQPFYGPTHVPSPLHTLAPEPSIGTMLQSTLPTPPSLSSIQDFSMNSEGNLGMFDATMGMNEFFGDGSGDGSSDNDMMNFDPSIFLNLDFDDV